MNSSDFSENFHLKTSSEEKPVFIPTLNFKLSPIKKKNSSVYV